MPVTHEQQRALWTRRPRHRDIPKTPRPYADVTGACDWCGKALPKYSRCWCSDMCQRAWLETWVWGMVVARFWRERQRRCAHCGEPRGYELDHVIPIADGGARTETNLQLLCRECHSIKTAVEAAQRALEDPILLGLRRLELAFGATGYEVADAVDLVGHGNEGRGVRTVEQLSRELLKKRGVALDPMRTVATLVRRGEAEVLGDELRLTEHGRFLADAIMAQRIDRQEWAARRRARQRERETQQGTLVLGT